MIGLQSGDVPFDTLFPSGEILIFKPPLLCIRHIPGQKGTVLTVVLCRTEAFQIRHHTRRRHEGERKLNRKRNGLLGQILHLLVVQLP